MSRSPLPPDGHPAGLPDLFLDRSLGRVQVPALLRAAGLRVVTLSEQYGIPADETVTDVTWLRDAGVRGWVVLMKDDRIRHRPAEKAALIEAGVQSFVLSGNLVAAAMAQRVLDNLDAIAAACASSGPFVYGVHANRVVRLALDPGGPPGIGNKMK